MVDERERDLPRLRLRGLEAGISVVTRNLPVADYVWVLSPELNNLNVPYDGRRPEQEIVSVCGIGWLFVGCLCPSNILVCLTKNSKCVWYRLVVVFWLLNVQATY